MRWDGIHQAEKHIVELHKIWRCLKGPISIWAWLETLVFTDLFASSPGIVASTQQKVFLVSEARLALALLAPSIWVQSLVEKLVGKGGRWNELRCKSPDGRGSRHQIGAFEVKAMPAGRAPFGSFASTWTLLQASSALVWGQDLQDPWTKHDNLVNSCSSTLFQPLLGWFPLESKTLQGTCRKCWHSFDSLVPRSFVSGRSNWVWTFSHGAYHGKPRTWFSMAILIGFWGSHSPRSFQPVLCELHWCTASFMRYGVQDAYTVMVLVGAPVSF